MSWQQSPDSAMPSICHWPLELSIEVCAASRCRMTDERLRSLAALLNEADGVSLAEAEAAVWSNLVRVRLMVDACDVDDALDRVSALVRDSVHCVGLGSAVLVAARLSPTPSTGRRMG